MDTEEKPVEKINQDIKVEEMTSDDIDDQSDDIEPPIDLGDFDDSEDDNLSDLEVYEKYWNQNTKFSQQGFNTILSFDQ